MVQQLRSASESKLRHLTLQILMALDFIAGCLGGCAGVAIGHPFDTIKVKLQTQDYKNPIYRGAWDCFTQIVKTESVAGMYRGVWSPMYGVALVNAVVFGVYGNLQRSLAEPDSLRSHFLAGASAGLAQSIVSSPVELVKTRMQTNSHYQSTMDCFLKTLRKEGVQGVFKGLTITGVRDFLGYGFYFATYEAMTKISPGESPVGTPMMLLAGGVSGTVSWILTYPLDVVKSRYQADIGTYSGLLDCLKKSVQNEGIVCLTRGLMPTIVRAFPTNAVTFAVVTWVIRSADIFENKSLNIKNTIKSMVNLLPKEKFVLNNAEVVDETVNNIKFNWFKRMNAQRYFLISEDLWVNDGNDEYNDETMHESLMRCKSLHKENENKTEADLTAAELKVFSNMTQEIIEHGCDINLKPNQITETFGKEHR